MADDSKPTVELFVRAAPVDKEDKGPCPISQQWFMAFYILVEKRLINLRVTPINLDQPPLPTNYSALDVGRRLPVAWVESGASPQTGEDISGIVADTNDAIENLIDLWQCPNLAQAKNNPEQRDAEKASEDLYKHFNLMLKDGGSKPLESDLKKLDEFLGRNEHRYMLGDELCYADCMTMPKLQHIRVAGKAYKEFEIPSDNKHVWKYVESMYATQAFYLSCPADCDVLFHYMDKAKYPKGRKLPTLMSIEEKLCTVPDDANTHTYEPIALKTKVDGHGE